MIAANDQHTGFWRLLSSTFLFLVLMKHGLKDCISHERKHHTVMYPSLRQCGNVKGSTEGSVGALRVRRDAPLKGRA